jgi:hypothetical protein
VPKAAQLSDASGAVVVSFTSPAAVYPNAFLGIGSDWLIIAGGTNAARIYDGATENPQWTFTPATTAGTALGVSWGGASMSLYDVTGLIGSHSYDGAFQANWDAFKLGTMLGGHPTYLNAGVYSLLIQCRKIGGCR